jgi:hypothetical protein
MFFSLLLAVPLPASGLQRESARPGGPMRAGDALASVVHRTRCQQRERAQVEKKFTPAHGHARRVDQRR